MNQKNNIKTTTNRSEFNRKYKKFLADSGKIKCRYCKYNQGENNKNKWYGGIIKNILDLSNIKYPNWKLVSKNRKQWMNKKKKFIFNRTKFGDFYYEIKFNKKYF